MDRIQTPYELDLQRALAELRAQHDALQRRYDALRASRRPVRLPPPPRSASMTFLRGVPLAIGVFLGGAWLDHVPVFAHVWLFEAGAVFAAVVLAAFFVRGIEVAKDYTQRVQAWEAQCAKLLAAGPPVDP